MATTIQVHETHVLATIRGSVDDVSDVALVRGLAEVAPDIRRLGVLADLTHIEAVNSSYQTIVSTAMRIRETVGGSLSVQVAFCAPSPLAHGYANIFVSLWHGKTINGKIFSDISSAVEWLVQANELRLQTKV